MIWKKFFARSLFFRLMASFLLVIVIVSSFFIVSFSLYINNLQSQLVGNIQEKFEITCNKYDYEFEKITDTLYRLYSDEYFKPVLSSNKMTYLDMFHLENLMHSYISLNEDINTIFLISNNSDLVITSTGTFSKDDFFNKFYSSTGYNFDFWDVQQQKKFDYYFYNFYNPAPFVDLSAPNTYNKRLMPVAFKLNQDSDFIMVALVDVQAISSGIDKSFLNDFIILNADGAPVYTSLDPEGPIVKLAEEGRVRNRDGYFLRQDSHQNGIRYYRYLPNLELRDMLVRMNAGIAGILVVSIMLSILLSYVISRSTNNLARKIVDIMGAAAGGVPGAGNQTDLQHIRSSVQTIVEQNSRYSNEIKSKDLILEDFFYRTKLKDIHVQFDEPVDRFTIRSNFILVCFTLHFKEFYFEKAGGADQSQDTFRIKELLGRGAKKYFSNSITFQTETNQIVSILNAESRTSDLGAPEAVAKILEELREGEPFVFFTVAVSAVKNDILELDSAYSGMLALSRKRKLIERNQILCEGFVEAQESKFFFSMAQEEHFSEYLSNGRVNECIQQVDEILEFNLKNGTDNFHFQLLCTEIVNCGERALTNMNRDLPGKLNVSGIYEELGQCWKADQFRAVCKEFIIAASERINTFEKSSEYILDYIKEYVENHYAEDIFLDLFVDRLHLSKSYISRVFKSKTGINFSDWLNDFRMRKAVELLNSTTMKVQDIGRSIGCNTNTFIRSFKKYSGKTPSEYRQARLLDR